MTNIEDLTGKIIGTHIFKEICRESIGTGKIWWMAECINCGKVARRRRDYEPGCVNCNGLPKGYSGLTVLMSRYKCSCKDSRSGSYNLTFELTRDQFKELTSMECHYCGKKPEKIVGTGNGRSSWGEYVYNGIDRKDNNLGYIYSNCLPCCTICNIMKSDMSYSDFIKWIYKVANNINKNNKFQT